MEGETSMKDVVKFLDFLCYTTAIFFLPNTPWIILLLGFHVLLMLVAKISWKRVTNKTLKILPFILFTFVINGLLDEWKTAIWISIKLWLVCQITVIYSETTSIMRCSRNDLHTLHTLKTIAH